MNSRLDPEVVRVFQGPARIRTVMRVLRALPPDTASTVLAVLAIVDGVLRRRRFRRATTWAAAQGVRGWARHRMAFALLAGHGRFVAQEAMIGVPDLDHLRRTSVLTGTEHLERVKRGAVLLGFHLGPPRAWLALRAHGWPVHFVGRDGAGEGTQWADLVERQIVIPLPAGDSPSRVPALHRLTRLLADGAIVYMTADGPFGREAFRIDVPGGAHVMRAGWLALRRLVDVPVLPTLVHGHGRLRVIAIHAPLPDRDHDPARDAEACRAALTPLIAAYVRQYPTQCRYLAFPPWES